MSHCTVLLTRYNDTMAKCINTPAEPVSMKCCVIKRIRWKNISTLKQLPRSFAFDGKDLDGVNSKNVNFWRNIARSSWATVPKRVTTALTPWAQTTSSQALSATTAPKYWGGVSTPPNWFFIKVGQVRLIFHLFFCLFVQKIWVVSRIRTQIVGVEGEDTDD